MLLQQLSTEQALERTAQSATLKIRGGCDRDCYGKKAGKGALIQWEKAMTIGVSQNQTLFVWKETATAPRTKVTDG